MKNILVFLLFLSCSLRAQTPPPPEWSPEDIAAVKQIGYEVVRALYFLIGGVAALAVCQHLTPWKKNQ